MPTTPLVTGRGCFAVFGGWPALPEMLDLNALLTASEAASYAHVTRQAIGNWASRGYLLPDGKTRVKLPVATDMDGDEIRDAQGRPKYRLLDVAKAEAATSKRARRAA